MSNGVAMTEIVPRSVKERADEIKRVYNSSNERVYYMNLAMGDLIKRIDELEEALKDIHKRSRNKTDPYMVGIFQTTRAPLGLILTPKQIRERVINRAVF